MQRSRQTVGLPWLCCGWAGSPLAATGQGVCAWLLVVPGAKISPKLSLADRRGGAVFQEEMRNHFTILDWLEKQRAIQSPSISSDMLVCGEISECHRESSPHVTPEELPLLSHPLAPVKVLSAEANPSLADGRIAFSTSGCCWSL